MNKDWKQILEDAGKRKESIGVIFPPFEEKFKKEAAEILYANLASKGFIIPEQYLKELGDAYLEIGKLYFDTIGDNKI